MRRVSWLPIVIFGWLALAPPAVAATRSVDCRAAHGALVAALAHAPAGDVLLVRGRCDGPFDVTRNVTLRGHPRATLDGRGIDSTVTVGRHAHLRLVDLTVTNGASAVGGGIFSGNPSLVVLIGSTVAGNRACEGLAKRVSPERFRPLVLGLLVVAAGVALVAAA